jgi:hypothetical protein
MRFLLDRECALVELLCLGIAGFVLVQLGKVVEVRADVRMVGAEHLLIDRERALIERLGLGVAAMVFIQRG